VRCPLTEAHYRIVDAEFGQTLDAGFPVVSVFGEYDRARNFLGNNMAVYPFGFRFIIGDPWATAAGVPTTQVRVGVVWGNVTNPPKRFYVDDVPTAGTRELSGS
jgi:hypothetical protein